MPPTGLQRDPYGGDTEGATIPRLKPWVTSTQPPRGYPHCLQDCLPLFAEHIGGVAQRDEGVDTVSLTPLHRLARCLPLFAEHIGGVAQRDEGVDAVSLTP